MSSAPARSRPSKGAGDRSDDHLHDDPYRSDRDDASEASSAKPPAARPASIGLRPLIVTSFPPEIGGPATQASHLVAALRGLGHRPVVVAFDRTRTGIDEYEGTKVYRLRLDLGSGVGPVQKARRYAHMARELNRILARERPDVVHCNSVGIYAFVAATIARRRGIPSVVKFASDLVWEVANRSRLVASTIDQAHRLSWKMRLLARAERLILSRFTLVWATSEYRRDTLVRLLGIRPDRIRVIPNFIRLPDVPEREQLPAHAGFVIATGGRFVPHKRMTDAIEALALLPDGAILRVTGGGEPEQESPVDRAIEALGVGARVERIRTVPYRELIGLLGASDAYLSTSIEEGFAISMIEAMAVGLPIVAVHKGSVPEVVPDGVAGLLVEAGDVQGMAGALRRLMEDPALRERLGRAGQERARRFDLRSGVDEYRRLYEDAIRVGPGRNPVHSARS